MAVARVEIFVAVHRLTEIRGPSCAWYDSRESVLVKVTDDDEVCGWGETGLRPGVTAAIDKLAEMLVGRDPRQTRAHFAAMSSATHDGWAISALSIALDDLRARRLDIPISDLYGGAVRERVQAYASSGGYYQGVEPEHTWPGEVAGFVEQGFGAIKLRIGRYDPAYELPLLARIRDQLPAEVKLIVDGNGAYGLPQAIAVGRELEQLGVLWYEEPIGASVSAYQRLAASLDIPIAAGEDIERRSTFVDFMTRGAADIVQPDVSICGGIGEALFIAEAAHLQGRQCVPHAWGGAIVLAATLQLLALLPDDGLGAAAGTPLLEYDTFENSARTELVTESLALEDGWLRVPTGPGLGIEVDDDFVERMTVRIDSAHGRMQR